MGSPFSKLAAHPLEKIVQKVYDIDEGRELARKEGMDMHSFSVLVTESTSRHEDYISSLLESSTLDVNLIRSILEFSALDKVQIAAFSCTG